MYSGQDSNRTMVFDFGLVKRKVIGGSYYYKPDDHIGVKMAAEINKPCDVSIPTKDFSVPDPKDLHKGIREVLPLMAAGKPVFVGCMGGVGRTGLFLACLAKALGQENPVGYVRTRYHHHAVETRQQRLFVEAFDVSEYKWMVRWLKIKALFV